MRSSSRRQTAEPLSCKRYAIARVSNSWLIREGGSVSCKSLQSDFKSLMSRLGRAAISAEIR